MEWWSKQAAGVIRGPKWPKEHSPGFTQGLPWVDSSTEPSPEGAGADIGSKRSERIACRFWPLQHLQPGGPGVIHERRNVVAPCEGKRLFSVTQGKPWAELFCPCGARRPVRTALQATIRISLLQSSLELM
jgi:hypothetical protein